MSELRSLDDWEERNTEAVLKMIYMQDQIDRLTHRLERAEIDRAYWATLVGQIRHRCRHPEVVVQSQCCVVCGLPKEEFPSGVQPNVKRKPTTTVDNTHEFSGFGGYPTWRQP